MEDGGSEGSSLLVRSPEPVPEPPVDVSKLQSVVHVMPGQDITAAEGFLRGHGTFAVDKTLVASLSGTVDRVNKLISVSPLRSRYIGDVGDVVVGRIREVGQKRWTVEINALQDGVLLLSSINFPGGVLRRRTDTDALNMRKYFVENDLICAEVQQFYSDGAMSLHTRSLKYGKLEGGLLVIVEPGLIKRAKSAFLTLEGLGPDGDHKGVTVILAHNGWCWLHPITTDAELEGASRATTEHMLHAERLALTRAGNCIRLLNERQAPVSAGAVATMFDASLRMDLAPKQVCLEPHADRLMQLVMALPADAHHRGGGGDE